jgi:DNA-binding NarL/FixJ family response regulator
MTVYVIEDHPLMRDALTMLIHRVRPGLKVVPIPQMKLLDNAVEKNGFPELFCLDLQLPDTIGMSGVHIIKAKYPDVLLAVVTSADPNEFEDLCLQAGADVFIEKSNNPTQIIEVFRELLISPEMAAEEASSGTPALTKLSKRQKQLILMLDQGLSNREIAEHLDISEHTVKVHFWRLFRRLGVNSRIQAVHFARTNGWLS